MSKKKPYISSFLVWTILVVASFISQYFVWEVAVFIDIAVAINIGTFLLFGIDKFSAIQKWRRVPEKIFYLVTFFGGSLGTLVGMNIFKHKTSKTNFQFVVAIIIMIQLLIIYLLRDYIL